MPIVPGETESANPGPRSRKSTRAAPATGDAGWQLVHDAAPGPDVPAPARKPAARKAAAGKGAPGKPAAPAPGSPDALLLGSDHVAFGPLIQREDFRRWFRRAYLLRNGERIPVGDGKFQQCIVAYWKSRNRETGKMNEMHTICWIGDIEVIGQFLAYEIVPTSRKLKSPEWSRYVTIRTTDHTGRVCVNDIAAMDFNKVVSQAQYPDKLGFTLCGQPSLCKEFVKISSWETDTHIVIQGQGPLVMDDGSPSNSGLGERNLRFVSRSVTYDHDGNSLDSIRADLSGLPQSCDYYDLTPLPISPDKIREGCKLFAQSYRECPDHAMIPAAYNGQLFTGFIAAYDPRFWSGIVQTGKTGSGKSRYSQRYDSIQARASRVTRGPLGLMMPVINMGDTHGTKKGPGRRLVLFGGFTVTTDDILREGDTEQRIREQCGEVKALVNSFEAGGGPQARVNRAANKIDPSEYPPIQSSIRFISEIPLTIPSLLNRLIILPHLTDHWGSHKVFNRVIAETLSTPENRELMHCVYSAYVPWALARINTDLETIYEKAVGIVSSWGLEARQTERYAVIVAGNLMLEAFCSDHKVSISAEIAGAINALRENSLQQAGTTIPLYDQFARDLRDATQEGYCGWMGPPTGNPSDIHQGLYSAPGEIITDTDADGTERAMTMLPAGLTIKDLGLVPWGSGNVRSDIGPNQRGTIYGYFSMPNTGKAGGRPNKNPLLNRPLLVLKREDFERMCKHITKGKSYSYEPRAVIRSLRDTSKGDIIAMGTDRNKFWVIDAVWALSPAPETSDGDDL